MESRLVYTHKTVTPALAVDRIHCNHAVLSNHALLTRTHANGSNCNYCNSPQRVKRQSVHRTWKSRDSRAIVNNLECSNVCYILVLYCLRAVLLLGSGLILHCLRAVLFFRLWINPILLTSGSLFGLWMSTILSSILQYSMDDNFGEWVESMGVASGRG